MDSEKEKESEKKGSRKKSLARKRAGKKQSEESTKRQKIEDDVEKEELKAYLDLVRREEFAMEIESLATKYPISYDLMLWGDLKIIFEPDEEDEVWRNQHEYNLISWRLSDSSGIHILLMNNGIAIYMMIEKKYPLTQEMLSKMLSRKLEVDHERGITLVELGSHLRIEESLGMQDSDNPKGNNVVGPSVVNMVEHNNSSRYNDNKGKRKHHDNTKADPNKKSKVTCWKCGKPGHLKKDCKGEKVSNKANSLGTNGSVDGSTNSLKGQNMFNKSFQVYYVTYVSEAYYVQDDDVAWINIVNDNIASTFRSTSKLNDSILWHARLGHVHFKRMQDMSKDGLIPAFDMDFEKCKTCILNKITKKPFQNVKSETEVLELIHSDLCDLHATPSLGNKKYFVTFIDDPSRFCYVYLLQSKGEALDKFKVFKTEVKLQQVSQIKRFKIDRGVVRLPDPKLKTLGDKGIECICVGYAEHSKAFRFYVIEPNDSVSINMLKKSTQRLSEIHRFKLNSLNANSILDFTGYTNGRVNPNRIIHNIRASLRRGASFTQGTIPSIPIGGSISPEGFLLPILLLVMIIATIVVTVVVVVAVGGVSSILKLSFMVIGFFLGTILLYQESFKFRPGYNGKFWNLRFSEMKHLNKVLVLLDSSGTGSLPSGRGVYVGKDGGARIQACFRDELDNVVKEEDGGCVSLKIK
ncbi:zinc finger, CCHC-type containing protein [Tanacetum coccineum]